MHPNPARGGLAVRFGTAARGPVRLGVYDVAGRLVQQSMDTVLDAGDYLLNVDLGGASTGMYFLKLWTPAGALHRTFVLMK